MALQEEWSCLIRGAPALSESSPTAAAPIWLQAAQWSQLLLLQSAVPALQGVAHSMGNTADSPSWQAWANAPNPHISPLPAGCEPQLNSFQRLLLLKVGFCFVQSIPS